MKIENNHVAFWGGWLSNFYPSPFTEDGIKFFCVEQYFMYHKAMHFNDIEIANEILQEKENPKVVKKLGRKVKGFSDEEWDKVKYQIMKRGTILKYTNNSDLMEKFMDPDLTGMTFVEASPYDKIWGVGCEEEKAVYPENWKGQNIFGLVLTEVHDLLKEKENTPKF